MNKLIIGKTGDNFKWLPLWVHLRDTAGVMQLLLEDWVSDATIEGCGMEYQDFWRIAVFVAYTHDIGKATSYFQKLISNYCPLLCENIMQSGLCLCENMIYRGKTPHSFAGQWILQSGIVGIGVDSSVASVIGAHHGKIYSGGGVNGADDLIELYPINFYGEEGNEKQIDRWQLIWKTVVREALELSGIESVEKLPDLSVNAQILLSGLLIVADWIASNTNLFPLISCEDNFEEKNCDNRILEGWNELHFPKAWHSDVFNMGKSIFKERFGFEPNVVQNTVTVAVNGTVKPGIFIIEAQMGVGKTEAALAAAEVIASKCNCNGIFFGLPTQATANGLYDRLYEWASAVSEDTANAIRLAHGGANYNEEYQQQVMKGKVITSDEDLGFGVYVHPWFQGNKKALLSDFVIGTVDQLLMSSLRRRHFMLRHLGLSGKVVIIDECHAYDTYMNQYLDQSIEWMAGYGVPVILLSATLPIKRREELVNRYLKGLRKSEGSVGKRAKMTSKGQEWTKNTGYPMLTWTDNGNVHQINIMQQGQNRNVHVAYLYGVGQMVDQLKERLHEGGCACVILNTVRKAQNYYRAIKEGIPDAEVLLYHAQFTMEDRLEKERILLKRMGKKSKDQDRYKFILIGTQVLEQSLDYDADVMFTELCPIDLLLQRVGRLHRHSRCDIERGCSRPRKLEKAECYVLLEENTTDRTYVAYDDGSAAVYGDYLLMRTINVLPTNISIPKDIPQLVQRVYDRMDDCDISGSAEYLRAQEEFIKKLGEKEKRAKTFLLKRPKKNIQKILSNEFRNDDQNGNMSVRDIQSSIEIILMKLYSENMIGFVSDTKKEKVFSSCFLEEKDGIEIARQRLYLPHLFGNPGLIRQVIDALEERQKVLAVWQKNPWLQGELILVLDSENSTTLCGYRICYDFEIGLVVEKEEKDG